MNSRAPLPNDKTIIKMDHSNQKRGRGIQSKSIRSNSRALFVRSEGGTPSDANNKSSPCPSRNQRRNARVCVGFCVCVWVCYSEAGHSLTFGYKNSAATDSGRETRDNRARNRAKWRQDVHRLDRNRKRNLTWSKAESSLCPWVRVPVKYGSTKRAKKCLKKKNQQKKTVSSSK